MSGQKNKTPLIAMVAVVLLAVAGAVAYFTQKSPDAGAENTQETAAAVQGEQTQNPENVDTAAGNAAESVQAPVLEVTPEGLDIEPGNPVVAKVDGKEIKRTDVYRFIQTMPANVQKMPASAVYPMAMEQVINTRIVQTQADEAKIQNTPEFQREMDVVKQQIARNLYIQNQVNSKISNKDIKKSYDDFIKKIPNVEERHARHILVETEGKAKAVVDKLKKGGDFAEVAKELSVGPTATKGGDLGYFAKTEMVPEFANAAFGMEKNSILETPVKTQFGWHVIQVLDIRQRPKPTLEQTESVLRAELNRKALDGLLQEWRKDAEVEQFDINGKPLKDGANVIGIVPPKPKAEDKKDG